jgi:hypothetical protein
MGFNLSNTTLTYSGGFGAGDALYIVWFPTMTTPGVTVSSGTSYGVFRTDTPDSLGTMAWTAPADGTTQSLFSLDNSLGGNPAISNSAFTANFTAVPEPATVGLFGVAALGVILLRRRFRAS